MAKLLPPHQLRPCDLTLSPPLAELLSLRQTRYPSQPEALDAITQVLHQAQIRFLIDHEAQSVLIRDRYGTPVARISPS